MSTAYKSEAPAATTATLAQAVAESKAELDPALLHQDFFERASEAYVVSDLAGRIRAVNPAAGALFRNSIASLPGRALTEFVDETARSDFRAHLAQVVRNGNPADWETSLRGGDDRPFFIAVHVVPIMGLGGTPIALTWLLRDEDGPRRAAETRMLEVERLAAIGQMVTGLAHEGRNALQRSQACMEMLRLILREQPKALDLLARIQRAQDDLQRLYEEVRGYSAPIVLRRQPSSVRDIADDAWANVADERRGRDARFHNHCPASAAQCNVDSFYLMRVFENIFENALAACSDPVEVDVRCEDSEVHHRAALRVTIRDNGPGLTQEQQQKIFEPFYTTKTRGTGLGMAIARRIIEAHDGRIDAADGPARGASIIITLPRGMP